MDSASVLLLLGAVNGELKILQNPSKSLKKPLLRQKDDNLPQVRKFSVKLTLIFIHTWGYIAMGEANSKNPVHLL